MSVTPDERAALHAFCAAERELMRIAAESKEQVRGVTSKRDACITELLACMEDTGVECIAVASAGLDVKYARVTQSHTTRDLTPTLVQHVLVNRYDDLVALCKSKPDMATDEVINCIYEIVKEERNTYKPIVTFSNHLPRGLQAEAIIDVTTNQRLQQLVLATKETQAEHARLLQEVRSRKQALEEQRDAHVDNVQSFLQRQESGKQCIMDGSNNVFYIRKKTVKRSTPLTVAQFKTLLSTALEQLQDARLADTGLPPPDQFATVLTNLMEQTKTRYSKDIIKLDFAARQRNADPSDDEE